MPQPEEQKIILGPVDAEAAREQSAEYLGFVTGFKISAKNGEVFEIPNPSLLDDEQQDRYDALQMELETWDRHPGPVDEDGEPKLDASGQPIKGALMEPHRKDGERVEPYNTQLMKALFGDRYQRAKDAGIRANQVSVHWWHMNKVLAERRAADPKSVDSAGNLVSVSDGDRVGPVDVPPPVNSGVASGDDEQSAAVGAAAESA
jgi:hypothetical protein